MKVAADSAPAVREQFMRVALTMAERGMAAGGPPVGACLVRDTEVIASAHNAVISDLDVTAHAEVAVIRSACRELRALDLHRRTLPDVPCGKLLRWNRRNLFRCLPPGYAGGDGLGVMCTA